LPGKLPCHELLREQKPLGPIPVLKGSPGSGAFSRIPKIMPQESVIIGICGQQDR